MDSSIEPTIGPYEVYEDEWFNFKAAFEAFITVARRRRDGQADEVRRPAAGHREPPADRSEVPQPEAGRPRAYPRGERNPGLGRRQLRRADGGLQPAQRRARGAREGRQARHAAQRPGGEVQGGARAHLEGGARGRRPAERVTSTPSSPTRDARADARPRAAPDHRRGARHDGATGTEGDLQRHRGSQGGHLRPVRAAVPHRQGGRRQGHTDDHVRHVPRVGVPVDSLRGERGPRPRYRDPDELPARQRRVQSTRTACSR